MTSSNIFFCRMILGLIIRNERRKETWLLFGYRRDYSTNKQLSWNRKIANSTDLQRVTLSDSIMVCCPALKMNKTVEIVKAWQLVEFRVALEI